MRLRSVLAAVAVPAVVLSAFGGLVLFAEDQFGSSSASRAPATVVQPGQPVDVAVEPAAPAPDPVAAAAPAKAAPRAAKSQKPVVAPGEYAGYQRGIIAAIDGWWESALARAGVSYSGPRVTVAAAGKKASSRCGQAVANPADVKKSYPAFYCRGDRTVYLSSGWLYGAIYPQFGRGGVAAIIAHEFGHHIQHSIGIADPQVSRQELQADCLAGIWVHSAVSSGSFSAADVADARQALRALGDRRYESRLHHGTPAERSVWFERGLRSGDAYVCNHF